MVVETWRDQARGIMRWLADNRKPHLMDKYNR